MSSGTAPRGRPRNVATDEAILRAAAALVAERGVAGTTLSGVARRAGVARATVYLRWPNRSAIVGAVARLAVGGQPLALSGDIEADIRSAAIFIQRVFDTPALPVILPEIVRGILARPQELTFDSVIPRRRDFSRHYAQHAAAQGFDPTVDPSVAMDLLLGSAINYLLATGRPLPAADATKLADIVIRGLRQP